jgi:hypothetical protein
MGLAHGVNIVKDGLVFYVDAANPRSYPGSGTTWNDLVGANNGTLTNGPTFNAGNGGSIVFDSTNYVLSQNTPSESPFDGSSTEMTVCSWVNPDALINAVISSIYQSSISSLLYFFAIKSDGKIRFSQYSNSTSNYVNNTTDSAHYSAGEWSFVVATLDTTKAANSRIAIYFNGSEVASTADAIVGTPSNPIASATSPIRIGHSVNISNNSSQLMNGKISNISIYNRALTADEIRQNYNALKGRFGL